MFVYLIGNAEQNVFKLGVAGDPLKSLIRIQGGNPYKLSVVSKICVESKNAATLIEGLGRQKLNKYAGAGGWFVDLPDGLREQFGNGHYLRAIAAQAGVKTISRNKQTIYRKGKYLQGLSDAVQAQGLTFEDALEKVEQAYNEGVSIDKIML